ncbi:hypothetical protein SAMN05216249_1308 [Acetitomaculum ruminis DSM 5522]|uniref:Sensory transduction regulator n=1 Tax=Acetitomaculum ruminis DSM 5522 TaxID=1120918 RepID=A0A1I1AQ36_9FIRM|nr:hypothetical protein [Acetitomaculum ruminis]SFB38598.1 hypothetical protein SAMN05216249_1308 [Acetitomaculum ruminis DSM 5522]
MIKTYPKKILPVAKKIENFLIEDGRAFSYKPDFNMFSFDLKTKNEGRYKELDMDIYVRENEYTVYAYVKFRLPVSDTDLMLRMSEFICRANKKAIDGCFELNWQKGYIRYKYHVKCLGDNLPTKKMFKDSIIAPEFMFEKFFMGMDLIIDYLMDAKSAFEVCMKQWYKAAV